MLYELITAFTTLYIGANSNRLLMQLSVPGTGQGSPAATAPGQASTAGPVATNPAATNPAATSPATTAGAPAPVIPLIPALPIGGPPQPLVEKECVLPYPGTPAAALANPLSCAMKPTNLINPAENFKLNCGAYAACYGGEINIEYRGVAGMPMMVERIENMYFTEPYAAYYATVNIDARGLANPLKLDRCECTAVGACDGMTFNLYNVDVGDFDCVRPEYCVGCKIIQHDPVPGVPPVVTGCFNTF